MWGDGDVMLVERAPQRLEVAEAILGKLDDCSEDGTRIGEP